MTPVAKSRHRTSDHGNDEAGADQEIDKAAIRCRPIDRQVQDREERGHAGGRPMKRRAG